MRKPSLAIWCSLVASVAAVTGCASVPPAKPAANVPVSAVVVELDDMPVVVVFADAHGATDAVSFDDCADSKDCAAMHLVGAVLCTCDGLIAHHAVAFEPGAQLRSTCCFTHGGAEP